MKRVIVLNEADNVATALERLEPGDVIDLPQRGQTVEIREEIRFEHKFALRPISVGEPVIKYGVPIGAAYQEIAPGEHVHLHNLRSLMTEESGQEQEGGKRPC